MGNKFFLNHKRNHSGRNPKKKYFTEYKTEFKEYNRRSDL